MAPGGTVVLIGAGTASSLAIVVQALAVPLRSRLRGQRMVSFLASITREDLLILGELAAAGKIAPVIDRTYPLREAAEAVRYVETGQARGKVVITV
jgi:NADPH:quinone reductase-like Zn-dependent oxidoreductase